MLSHTPLMIEFRHLRPIVLLTIYALSGALSARAISADDAQAAAPSIEPKYLSNIQQITHDFTKAGEGYFSPDGKTIVFQAQPAEYMFYQIYTLPLDGLLQKGATSGRGVRD